jgi:hypothetical protein
MLLYFLVQKYTLFFKDPEWNFSHDFNVPDGDAKIFRYSKFKYLNYQEIFLYISY